MGYKEIYPHIQGMPVLDLKFRQIKCLAMHRERRKATWFVLNRQVPFSITNKTINKAIDFVQSKYRILRMYQTASEWFNPTTLGSQENDRKNLNTLLSSWMTIESDKTINYSLQLAHHVYNELYDRNIDPIVFSTGGKSIHLLFKFEYEKYMSTKMLRIFKSWESWDPKKRIWMDRLARKIFLRRIIPDMGFNRVIDWGTALDVRRVVPIINSRNVIERRWVTQLDPEELLKTSDYVWSKAANSIDFKFEELV